MRSIDVGIVWPPVDPVHLASEWLFNVPLLVLVAKSSPLARRQKLRLTDLSDQVLLMPNRSQAVNQKVLQMFRHAGVALKTVHTTSSPFEAGAMWVTAGKGIYVLTGTPRDFPVIGAGIAVVPLADPGVLKCTWPGGKTKTQWRSLISLRPRARFFLQAASCARVARFAAFCRQKATSLKPFVRVCPSPPGERRPYSAFWRFRSHCWRIFQNRFAERQVILQQPPLAQE